jgi:hypothetical protein
MKTSRILLLAALLPGLSAQPAPPPGRASGIKITFGVRSRMHGRVWSGGVRNPAQVRCVLGWHLGADDSLTQPALWSVTLQTIGGDVASKAVILDLASPESQPVTVFTRYGDFSFTPADIPWGAARPVALFRGDVTLERAPIPHPATGPDFQDDDPALLRARSGDYWLAWVAYATRKRGGDLYTGADEVKIARSRDGVRWSPADTLTPPGDHFRVALGEDARGHVWCVYAAQKQLETGNFDLYARRFDGRAWAPEERLTDSPLPDIFHRLAADARGNLHLVWMGYRPGPNGAPAQSDILMRVHSGGRWGAEINLSQSAENDWAPAVAVNGAGRAHVAWDVYRASAGGAANYDVVLRDYAGGALGPLRTVSATPFAEMRPDVAVDARGRIWVAWEEAGVNWGKDTGYENARIGLRLRPGGSRLYGPPNSPTALYRRPRVAVLDGGQWRQPRARLEDAYPESAPKNLYMSPRLGVGGDGRVWLFLRRQLIAQGRWGGQFFDYFATSLAGEGGRQRWFEPILLPASSGRQDTVLASAPAAGAIAVAVVGDGRRFPVPLPLNHDVATLILGGGLPAPVEPEWTPFEPSPAGQYSVTHADEARQVEQVRAHRVTLGRRVYRIVRGDVHRHTEICMDGGIDGSLWDLYRYAIDAAAMDYVAVTDHNYGAWLDTDEPESKNTDDEYQWWRTQKSADLFYVPGRFTPLYGYERSVNFPLGHRNILHVRRGVFSYRAPKLHIAERPELIERDARGLWAYLRRTGGIALPHSTGTNMGTDWRLRDDELEPVAEIYQGDRNTYEDEGQPRAATREVMGDGFAGRAPFQKGLIWNALGVGYRMGFIASSDHWSTHISYANLLVPEGAAGRAEILDAFRRRRTYGSTDNIVVDFHAGATPMGGELTDSRSPVFTVRVVGTEPILRVEIIKNNRIVYTRSPGAAAPDPRVLAFAYRDEERFADTSMGPTSQIRNWDAPETGIRPRPPGKTAYYYVRVIQSFSREQPAQPGEIAWSSPIYVTQ